jgi:hypothetical protein
MALIFGIVKTRENPETFMINQGSIDAAKGEYGSLTKEFTEADLRAHCLKTGITEQDYNAELEKARANFQQTTK